MRVIEGVPLRDLCNLLMRVFCNHRRLVKPGALVMLGGRGLECFEVLGRAITKVRMDDGVTWVNLPGQIVVWVI